MSFSDALIQLMRINKVLKRSGISAEIIDLRSIRPLDKGTILKSVKKTRNLLVLDNGWKSFGVSSEIISIVSEKLSGSLKSNPVRLGVKEMPIPSTRVLAKDFYIDLRDILSSIEKITKKGYLLKQSINTYRLKILMRWTYHTKISLVHFKMKNKNNTKFEKTFLNRGYLVEKVEDSKSLNYINNVIQKKIQKLLKTKKTINFNHLHKIINEKNLNKMRLSLINHINNDKNFKDNYFNIAKKMLEEIVGNELAIQNNINLSIQLPNDESSLLPLHSDTWSGDSPFESVLWIPLVNCYNTKSMFILNSKKLKNFNKNFNSKKIKSVSDLYNKYKKDLKFIKIDHGQYLLFNQNLPHGNLVNRTKETRISLNCRFKGLFTPYSQKELGSFFPHLNFEPQQKLV